ncbi:MAG: hypothetical protein IPF92_13800 [Myxococcales bacterium]|nr:hypothetical protein [Myxococcales bacterium]
MQPPSPRLSLERPSARLGALAALAALGALGVAACDRSGPAAAAKDAAPAPSSSAFGFVVPPPTAMVMPDAPDAALPAQSTWSVAKLPGEKLELRYPGELFLLDEEKNGVVLTSQLSAAPLEVKGGDGAVPPAYVFRGRLRLLQHDLVEAAKAEGVAPMFPGGKRDAFVEATGRSQKLTVASHAAYMQRVMAHGFNATVVLVELAPKRTLIARFDTIGEELRPRVEPSSYRPEAWQQDLAMAVVTTLRTAR